jgi:methylmalonyl-CoA/ethylmalonyl-CoA epimerase
MNTTAAQPTTVHLENICQVALTVQDLARSRKFYQDKLGMKFLFDAGSMAFFQCGPVRFMIGLSEQPASGASGTIIYFKVEGLQEIHAALSGQGIAFLAAPHVVARMPDHDLWLALLRDPDGNTLGLMSEVARPPGS